MITLKCFKEMPRFEPRELQQQLNALKTWPPESFLDKLGHKVTPDPDLQWSVLAQSSLFDDKPKLNVCGTPFPMTVYLLR